MNACVTHTSAAIGSEAASLGTTSPHPLANPHPCQRGSALIVGLIFLIIMTLIGVTAMQTTTLEEKMAGNMRDQNLAFQAAESAVRDAETWMAPTRLKERPPACTDPTSCDVWEKNYLIDRIDLSVRNDTWWIDNSHEYGSATGVEPMAEVSANPRYIIEEMDFIPDSLVKGIGVPPGRHYYRATGLGTGGTDSAQVVIETTYTRRY